MSSTQLRRTGRLAGDDCQSDWIWDREIETAAPAAILEIARKAWQAQLGHLLQDSSFHRSRLRAAGVARRAPSLDDLGRLPFSSKDDMKDAGAEMPPFGTNLAVDPGRVKRVYQTSGSTGSPSVLALTASDVESWTVIGTRTYYGTGIHDHSSVLSTFGAGPFVAGHTHLVLSRIGARSVPVGPGDTERVLFGLRAGLADTLLGTPSFAQHLANRLEDDAAASTMPVAHVVTGGEPGGGIPAIRDHVQDVLGVTVNEVMGIGDVAPSLFGECPEQQGMHFCGQGYIWPELIDPDSREPLGIETGAVGELVYTHLAREAMPVVRFLSADVVRIEGTSCACGRTSFRMRCLGRRDDMFIVRGVNVYPTAILAVVGEFRPQVTGRARVVLKETGVSIDPPVRVEVEVPAGPPPAGLAERIEAEVRSRLTFRCRVLLVADTDFGDAGYKTRLVVRRP